MIFGRFLDPKNDIAFKKIFGSEKNKDILIHFLNDILELKGKSEIIEVEFLSTILDAEIASKKESIVDVLCKDKNNVQYIVEMQVDPTKGFEKRAQYYAAKAYSRQPNRGKNEDGKYQNLKEVIFIAIADYILFPNKDKKEYLSRHIILDQKSYEHDLKDFSFTFIELPKFKKKKIEDLNNIIEKWCYFFKNAQKTSYEELEKLIGKDLVIKKAYLALDQVSWSEAELISYEREIKRIWDNKAVESYKLEKLKERAMEEAKKEVREEVRNEVKEEVREELKGEVKEEVREELKGEVKEEVREELKEEVWETIKIEMVMKLTKAKIPIDLIVESTGLTKEQIEKISKKDKS